MKKYIELQVEILPVEADVLTISLNSFQQDVDPFGWVIDEDNSGNAYME